MADLSVKALCVDLGLVLSYIVYSSVYRALRSGNSRVSSLTISLASQSMWD